MDRFGNLYFAVPNMPAACPRTASLALERAVLPYVRMLANGQMDADLQSGIQVAAGKVTHAELADRPADEARHGGNRG